jgi:DNA-binding response OmpR family regulator
VLLAEEAEVTVAEGKILLVEDDLALSDIVGEFLEDNGYEVTRADSFNAATDALYEEDFDLLILDVKIPDGDGFKLLRQIREQKKLTPTIFTTSLDSLEDLQRGYESGCDDYLRKPFELQELLLRVRAVIKREIRTFAEPIQICTGVYFDEAKRKIIKDNKQYDLPNKEFLLLKIFLSNKNVVLSHEYFFEKLWGWDEEPSEFSLRAYIKNLRKVIGGDCIKTLRGSGYRFESS